MFPLKDDVPSRTIPIVTIGLILLNAVVFLYQISLEVGGEGVARASADAFVLEFGVTPCRLSGACRGGADLPSPILTVFTSMFVHGGILHVLGNMLYLWIFGDNVEDTLGHGTFLLFYLASGVIAVLAQTLATPSSTIPMIGASGAVSGVLGAYLVLFPHARVLTLLVLGFFIRIVRVPAILVLGLWVAVQLAGSLADVGRSGAGRIAWLAHLGGFGAGLVLVFLMRPRARRRL
jgi:membrane associated rhomboid family serine protease